VERILQALGIRHEGRRVARILAQEFGSLDALRGGRVTSRISGQTDYLVAGEETGQKLQKAKKESVKIIDADRFEELLKGG
jgi:NAD-dependent DNA ligase